MRPIAKPGLNQLGVKKCSHCHQTKPLQEFTRDTTRKDGHLDFCKACLRKKTSETRLRWKQERKRTGLPAQKTCSGCKRTLPAEAFHQSNNSKDGLRPMCKACRKTEQKKVQARYQQDRAKHPATEKSCTSCKRTLPVASFHHARSTKDGYAVYCKQCTLRMQERYLKTWEVRRSSSSQQIQKKTCIHCNRTLPITGFLKNRYSLDGYTSSCKDCEKERRGAMVARWQFEKQPLEKQCSHCERVLPAAEFSKSRKSKDGLLYMCKGCAVAYYDDMKTRWSKERARAQGDFSLFAVTEKACRTCQRTLPLSAFYHRKESRDGLNASCKDCDAKRAKEKKKIKRPRGRPRKHDRMK